MNNKLSNKEKIRYIGTTEYRYNFWNVMRGNRYAAENIGSGTDISTGGFYLPAESDEKLKKAIHRRSMFRNLATVVKAYDGPGRIFAKDCDDLAAWVPEGGSIPIYDGINDFTRYPVDMHKLAVFVRLDNDFIKNAAFSIEDYLTERLGRNFSKAEDKGFITGTGDHMPTGIINAEGGAEIGVTTDSISFDDIVRLYFSLDEEYRKNAVWLMNDETALKLRLLKDDNGNHLWNHTHATIFGRPVVISNDMPSESSGNIPVIVGDLSYYWIIDRSPVSLRVLTEKFTLVEQTGYLAAEFLDGKLIRRDALKGIKIR